MQSGFQAHLGYFDRDQQIDLLAAVAEVINQAPFYTPVMPRTGKPFSVRMTNCGALGWVSDRDGYRYQPGHPVTRSAWPAIPDQLLALWRDISGYGLPPQACLINYYQPGARMGLHSDSDEADRAAPVVSISLGDSAVFRLGGNTRKGRTSSMRLSSGDVVVLGGSARDAYHGVDRVLGGSSRLLSRHQDLFPDGGRINLTLRRVTLADE